MRTIEKVRLTADVAKGQAELVLKLVEKGKILPFQVLVTHKGPTTAKASGVLSAVNDEEDAKGQFDFHLAQAGEKGWSQAMPGRLKIWAGVPEPDGTIGEGQAVAPPARRKLGRPRKVR